MTLSRRALIRSAASLAVAAPGLRLLGGCASPDEAPGQRAAQLPLVPDPKGLLDLPAGMAYAVVSRAGDMMADGLPEPAAHDGMAAFPVEGQPGKLVLVRNHELLPGGEAQGAFGADGSGASRIPADRVYDRSPKAGPHPGGTTTVLVDAATLKAERTHLSLAGTIRNCAGGPTPWGSWLSCEETEFLPSELVGKAHGFVFEVPSAGAGLAEPVPLKAMGRFNHEAAAVDPATGVVYLTEDQGDGLFYRFLPAAKGELAKGGRLQALALMDQPSADTRNWPDAKQIWPRGRRLKVRWIDLADVEAPDSDLRLRGHGAGAALFARGEGAALAIGAQGTEIYFACTSGGAAKRGQVWRYRPSLHEGQPGEKDAPAEIELFVESRGESEFDMCDNIVASPRGEIVMCEDGDGDNYVRMVAPDGLIYPLARNAHPDKSEFCGCTFSPDGRALFVNIQRPGLTLAITGDWNALARTARRMV